MPCNEDFKGSGAAAFEKCLIHSGKDEIPLQYLDKDNERILQDGESNDECNLFDFITWFWYLIKGSFAFDNCTFSITPRVWQHLDRVEGSAENVECLDIFCPVEIFTWWSVAGIKELDAHTGGLDLEETKMNLHTQVTKCFGNCGIRLAM